MRVVILYNSSWYVFLLRRNLIASLQKFGCEVTVIAPEDGYTERVKALGVSFIPIEMTRSGTSPLGELSVVSAIHAALRKAKPHVVLSFTAKCNVYAGLCKRAASFRHIANVSGLGQLFDGVGAMQGAARMLYRIALARTEEVFFQNRDDMSHLVGAGVVSARRATLLPGSGVDLARFTPLSRPVNTARSFLMFGRLLPKKGFYDFVKAAEVLTAAFQSRVAFWVLGAPDEERPESRTLLERILEAHARGYIRYLQSTDDPLPYIREADAVVLPSTYNEGIPRSLLEALACGKPVVTTDWKGCRETVDHGRNGFLVAPGSVESLIQALTILTTMDRGALAEFGRKSREIAEERFDENLVLGAYLRAVEQAA